MARAKHSWKFFRAGGVDQVVLASAADLENLDTLDQKLWVALACPTQGLEFDARTLALIDGDHDGCIRPPEILAALACVDAVVIFNELTPREIVTALLPDILVKGGDWADNKIIGREEVEAAGGRVVSIPVVPGYSTTEILRKIREGAPSAEAAAESATPAPPSPTKS